MSAQKLRSYFETAAQQRRALDAFFDAWEGNWCVSENLDLYEASQRAFDPSSSADDAFTNFEQIYNEIKSGKWQVFRPCRPVDCWQPQKIFDTIKREFPRFSAHPSDAALPRRSKFSWRGPVNLLNFPKSETGVHLESCLAKMREIKPKQGYPVMTVSKFLHFYNPGLFPIYDTAVIWGKVFSRFKNDFREFCEREKIPYDRATKEETATFLRDYMRWASSLLSVAHGNFMNVFVDWLDEQPGTELRKRSFAVDTLYATAFEFTVIGASAVS